MNEPVDRSRRIAVLGLGNPILTDDAVGLRVVDRLKTILEEHPIPGVDILVSTRAGFELIDLLQGYGRAVIVDCLDLPEPEPGRVRRLDLSSFAGSVRLNSAHDLNISTAFELARTMGIPMPASVVIFAVEGRDVRTLAESMTPAVEEAVEPLAGEIHAFLKADPPAVDAGAPPQPREPFYGP